MNKIEGDLSLEEYIVVRLTCGHAACLDIYSAPEEPDFMPVSGETLVYCIRCGAWAQVSRIIDKERTLQIVTCWSYTRQYIARDYDPKREALHMRQTDDPPSVADQPADSDSAPGVSGDKSSVDTPKGTEAGGIEPDKPGDILAS